MWTNCKYQSCKSDFFHHISQQIGSCLECLGWWWKVGILGRCGSLQTTEQIVPCDFGFLALLPLGAFDPCPNTLPQTQCTQSWAEPGLGSGYTIWAAVPSQTSHPWSFPRSISCAQKFYLLIKCIVITQLTQRVWRFLLLQLCCCSFKVKFILRKGVTASTLSSSTWALRRQSQPGVCHLQCHIQSNKCNCYLLLVMSRTSVTPLPGGN